MLIEKGSGIVDFSPFEAFGLLENKARIKYGDDVRSFGINLFTNAVSRVKIDFFKGFSLDVTINQLGLVVYHEELDMTYTLHMLGGEKESRAIEELDRMIERWIGDE